MARDTRPLTDDELRALCENELWSSTGESGDLAAERAAAMGRYLGEPRGDEVEGRSQIRTREVMETVEWVMPSLMRIFADAENICAFEPIGPEDEEAAQQETEAVEHVFWRQNRGFHHLYCFLKDGLISKTGILKVWWEGEPEEEREEYDQLNDWELAQLFSDPDYADSEVLEHEVNDDGTHRLVLIHKEPGRLSIEPCPPEEFGVDRDARSIFPDDAQFLYHRTRKTKAELIEAGYDRKTVEGLPAANDTLTQERNARRHLSDEQDREQGDHWSMERVWVTECYIRVDRNDDGIAELLKVTLAGADSAYTTGSTLLDVEEVDRQPFVVWSPVLLTHKFYGLSVDDLVSDLESIKTTLTRQILDNTYLANNGRTAANELVNLDDLLTSRPGGVVRTEGETPPGNHIMQLQQQPIPPQTFDVLDKLDEQRQRRVGVGDEVGVLDNNALANVNTGVAALAYDAARSKIELMARLCAEIGLRPLFLRIHELLRKNNAKQISLKLAGQWVPVNPQEWRERENMEVKVGIGRASRERRLMALSEVMDRQMKSVEMGAMGAILLPTHLYAAQRDYTRELGLDESIYWQDPAELPPPEPQPDPQLEMAQAQLMIANRQVDVEAFKAQSGERVKMAELALREQEAAARREVDVLKADLQALQKERDGAMSEAKVAIDAEIKTREQEIRAAEVRLEDQQKASQRELDIFKVLVQSGTALTQEQMRQVGLLDQNPFDNIMRAIEERHEQMVQSFGEHSQAIARQERAFGEAVAGLRGDIMSTREELQTTISAPKRFERDASGRVVSVNGQPVRRNASGQIESIG